MDDELVREQSVRTGLLRHVADACSGTTSHLPKFELKFIFYRPLVDSTLIRLARLHW